MDFKLLNEEGDTGTFIANGEWALLGMFFFYINRLDINYLDKYFSSP